MCVHWREVNILEGAAKQLKTALSHTYARARLGAPALKGAQGCWEYDSGRVGESGVRLCLYSLACKAGR